MIEVRKIGDKTISIVDSESGEKYSGSAIYYASSTTERTIIIKSNDDTQPTFVGDALSISIEGSIKNSIEEALISLNSFIGSFRSASATGGNSGGGVSPVSDTSWKREYVPLPANHQYAIRLKNCTETVISTALWNEVIVDVTCPREEAGKMTTCILVFSTEETVPRLNLPTNIVWKGETAPPLNPNTIYRLLFNIYEDKILVNTF